MKVEGELRRWRSQCSVAVFLTLLVVGCGPSRDKDGNRPAQVVADFVKAVQARDFVKAASYWESESVRNVQVNRRMIFEEFCLRRFACDRFTLGRATRQKMGYYEVEFEGITAGSETKTMGIYCRLVDGKWQIREDLWLQPEKE